MAKLGSIIFPDGKHLTINTESTLKAQFSCNLEGNVKENTIIRKLEDGKLVVECVMNNVTCTQFHEKRAKIPSSLIF
ncbi:unnamed protein product [Nyctereutes procyonoides]|uniref:(raccoon dog) hypothetical protein n=1 Tax=Nyctereutes procyonoides TaxID=34880 RepID=A0A811Y532_NYCPR|nr:unnamed protein product [Nyctereutes procyonoides]